MTQCYVCNRPLTNPQSVRKGVGPVCEQRNQKDPPLADNAEDNILFVDGKLVTPARSLAVVTHSPAGFSWGYGGSGPAQTALAILLECTSQAEALAFYQTYKWMVICGLPLEQKILHINSADVRAWLEAEKKLYGLQAKAELERKKEEER